LTTATFIFGQFLIGRAAGAHNAVAIAVCEEHPGAIVAPIGLPPRLKLGKAAIALAFAAVCRRYAPFPRQLPGGDADRRGVHANRGTRSWTGAYHLPARRNRE